jgi:hypothetical protein
VLEKNSITIGESQMMKILIPCASPTHDGTFIPNIRIDDGRGGGTIFFEHTPDADSAWERACYEI